MSTSTTVRARRKLSTTTTRAKVRGAVSAYAEAAASADRDVICNFASLACEDLEGLKAIVTEAGGIDALVDLLAAVCRETVRTGCDLIELQDLDRAPSKLNDLLAEVRSLMDVVHEVLDRTRDLDPDDDEGDEAPESD